LFSFPYNIGLFLVSLSYRCFSIVTVRKASMFSNNSAFEVTITYLVTIFIDEKKERIDDRDNRITQPIGKYVNHTTGAYGF